MRNVSRNVDLFAALHALVVFKPWSIVNNALALEQIANCFNSFVIMGFRTRIGGIGKTAIQMCLAPTVSADAPD